MYFEKWYTNKKMDFRGFSLLVVRGEVDVISLNSLGTDPRHDKK